jgi:hypothetical protein
MWTDSLVSPTAASSFRPEQELQIRRLYFAEHWAIGTIARQIGVHDEVDRRVAGLLSPRRRIHRPLADEFMHDSHPE